MAKRAPNQVDRMRRLYGWQARIYDRTRTNWLSGHEQLVRDLDFEQGARVLDVGCGTGRMLPALSRAVGPGGRVVGTDCVPAMLDRAAVRVAGYANVELALAAHEFDWPPGPFDAVTLAYSLTLMPRWLDTLDRVESRLASGGRIGVLDFAGRPSWPLRWLFEAHGIEFGAGRRTELRRRFDPVVDDDAHARAGLWQYFRFTGRCRT